MPRKRRIPEDDPTAILARIALEERAEAAQDKKRKAQARQVALEQMYATERDNARKLARFQKICDHLAGNHRIGVIPRHRYCALHKDYLSDGSVRIYCGKCRFEWHPGDTADAVFSMLPDNDGVSRKIALPNPTRQSWRDINKFFYTFDNARDLTSRAFRIERVEPEFDPNVDYDELAAAKDLAARDSAA